MTYGEADPDSTVVSASDLEEEAEPVIPSVLLRAMKDRMRSRRLSEPDDPDYVHCRLTGDDEDCTVYAINDGNDRCLIGRLVGRDSDGCIYCLVGFTSRFDFEQLEQGDLDLEDAFSASKDIALCGVFEDELGGANLFVVQNFRTSDRVPDEYLPPTPFVEFTDENSETPTETETPAEHDLPEDPGDGRAAD